MLEFIRSIFGEIRKLTSNPTIINGTVTANWNSGVATSGLPGADLLNLGAVGEWMILTEIYLRLASFNAGATVTVRAYLQMMGAEQLVMDEDYVVAAEPAVIPLFLWIFFVAYFIYGPVRIEVFSDQAADDGLAAPYEYRYRPS